MEKGGEHKTRNHKKELHYGPIISELRSMDRRLRSQDKKITSEKTPAKRKTPTKGTKKRKSVPKEEEEDLEVEVMDCFDQQNLISEDYPDKKNERQGLWSCSLHWIFARGG